MRFDQSSLPSNLRLGTSSFSSPDWRGVFYPENAPPHEFLGHYAEHFRTVEIDATWHFMPTPRTVDAWERKVPEGFLFSAKVPKVITHEKRLVGCADELNRFLETMDRMGPKLGPLLFQFQYVSERADAEEYKTGADFRHRLEAFLPLLPGRFRYVVEVRNPTWLNSDLTEILKSRGIALAIVDYVTMPPPAEWFERCDPVTADFAYLRFLGDHRSMDNLVARRREKGEKQGDWNEILVDRTRETIAWIPILRDLSGRVSDLFAYFNNHYAGFAPGSIELFLRLWENQPESDSASR